jgi:prepilin-type N-terminal cleavage/methylation domain-containing protein
VGRNRSKRCSLTGAAGCGGFTLLEVLVSLALLGIALTVILQIFSANLRNISSAEDSVNASAMASARMREIVDTGALTEDQWVETTPEGYNLDVSVSEYMKDRTNNLPVKLMQVDLTIHWMKGAREKSLTLRTVKTVTRS